MKILLCGGGTGGHITPILAIAHELKQADSTTKLYYVGERGGKFGNLVSDSSVKFEGSYKVFAGKLRRYHGESWLRRVTDFKTIFFNIRDSIYLLIGLLQSYFLLVRLRPDVIFLKGGFVGLPIGIAASILKIPYITHDSDAIPGLTNRIVGKKAKYNAVGIKNGIYGYNPDKIKFVGVPVGPNYKFVDERLKGEYRDSIGLNRSAKMLLITGGSLGAVRINTPLARVSEKLIDKDPELYVYHVVGKGNLGVYGDIKENERLKIFEFIPDIYKYNGAADVVVTRGGGSSTAELAIQGKPCIIIPNPQLTGGHQTINAKLFKDADAAIVVDEEEVLQNENVLFDTVEKLLNDKTAQKTLTDNISRDVNPNAAKIIAELLLSVG
jgi:UDP-N-acetylglucosamine--N-acetylmuramyl-(pentapeptide) pyrophosphoryl-undecaprenol N-acetylglucosamine transferase